MASFTNKVKRTGNPEKRCDHHVISHGTYGFWSAYLGTIKGAQVVVADGYYRKWERGKATFPIIWAKMLNWTLLWDSANEVNKNSSSLK